MQGSWITLGAVLAAAALAAEGPVAKPFRAVETEPQGVSPGDDSAAASSEEHPLELDSRALFLANCATCHGETGDGQGVTQLDRPARSFLEGGFSYGNTPKAILRSIRYGIPGTPMPSFESSLDEAQRLALAEYVISLGPEQLVVDPDSTVMLVEDRPRVVRGFLPPISPDAKAHPRGLLLGGVDGLTFEYRVDDVRLLGVRAGGFVKREDWDGRGGSALKPLGQVVHLVAKGDPGPMFHAPLEQADGQQAREPLRAQLLATWVRGTQLGTELALFHGDEKWIELEERVQARGTTLAAGFERSFTPLNEGGLGQPLSMTLAIYTAADGPISIHDGPTPDAMEVELIGRSDGTYDTWIARGSVDNSTQQPTLILREMSSGATALDLTWTPQIGESADVIFLSGATLGDGYLETIQAELDQ